MSRAEGGPGEKHVFFGPCYHTARGRSSGEHATYKYTNASASTPNILIMCDGGSRNHEILPQACVQALASTAGRNEAEPSLKELLRIGLLHKKLTSHNFASADACTLLLLQLSLNLETGHAAIASCQIGSTRWALLSWDETRRKFTCKHLSPDGYTYLTSLNLSACFNHEDYVCHRPNVTIGSLVIAGTEGYVFLFLIHICTLIAAWAQSNVGSRTMFTQY